MRSATFLSVGMLAVRVVKLSLVHMFRPLLFHYRGFEHLLGTYRRLGVQHFCLIILAFSLWKAMAAGVQHLFIYVQMHA